MTRREILEKLHDKASARSYTIEIITQAETELKKLELNIKDIINILDVYFERRPKAQDIWAKGYACIKVSKIRKLAHAILYIATQKKKGIK